jgi:purine/pyrimidine-nucleoside phosphorylase
MPEKIDNVSVGTQASVYFDGKCVSHSVYFPDGSRKTIGVIMPGCELTFNVGVTELMEITGGECEVKLAGEDAFKSYGPGSAFRVPENGSFEIKTKSEVNYVCTYG